MFYKWTGPSVAKYSLLHHADSVDEWEVVSDVTRPHTKGFKTFRNSCGLFQTEQQAQRAKQMLEGM